MRVPILERQVEENPTLLPTPQISPAISGAFGELPAEATEKLGEAGVRASTSLLARIQLTNFYKAKDQGYNGELAYAQVGINKMTSTDMQDMVNPKDPGADPRSYGTPVMNSDGSVKQQPVGVLNRQGFDAHNATFETKQYLEQQRLAIRNTLPQNQMVLNMFDNNTKGITERIINRVADHESAEWRKASGDLQQSGLYNQESLATLSNTPELLTDSIGNVAEKASNLANFKGEDEEGRIKKINDSVLKVLQNASRQTLYSTGDINKAKNLLFSVKDKVPDEVFDNAMQYIDRQKGYFETEIKQQGITQKIVSRNNIMNQFITGQADLSDPDTFINSISKKDPTLGEVLGAVIKRQRQGGEYRGSDRDFSNSVYKLFSDPKTTQEQMSDYFVNVMKEHPNLSKDRLGIIFNAAINKMKSLPLTDNSGDGKVDPQQEIISAHVKALQKWGAKKPDGGGSAMADFLQGIFKGKTPQVAHDEAIKTDNIKRNPSILQYPKKGQPVMDSDGNVGTGYPDGSTDGQSIDTSRD